MADQVSLPSMLFLRLLGWPWIDVVGGTWPRRQHLRHDLVEQLGLDVAICKGRHVGALPSEVRIGLAGQHLAIAALPIRPAGEAVHWQRLNVEVHVRES